MVKTYTWIDAIGIKEAFKKGRAGEKLVAFWNAADAWTNSGMHPTLQVLDQEAKRRPDVYVVTFSDTALMYTEPELVIEDYYKLVCGLQEALAHAVEHTYAIICRDEEVSPIFERVFGGQSLGSRNRPLYTQVAGSGPVWINLHLAERVLRNKSEWHDKYTLYCVDERSKPNWARVKAESEFRAFNGETLKLMAIE